MWQLCAVRWDSEASRGRAHQPDPERDGAGDEEGESTRWIVPAADQADDWAPGP